MGDLILIQWGQDFILRFKPNSSKENKINFTENQIDKEQPLSWSAAKPERGVEKKNVLSLSGKFKRKKKKERNLENVVCSFFLFQSKQPHLCLLSEWAPAEQQKVSHSRDGMELLLSPPLQSPAQLPHTRPFLGGLPQRAEVRSAKHATSDGR